MIEATVENIWYKRKKQKPKLKKIISWLIILCIIFGIYFFYKRVVCEKINKISTEYLYSFSTDAVNKAVLSSLSDSVKYLDLISIEKNTAGDIIYMGANSLKINTLSREVSMQVNNILLDRISDGIPIPLLTFLGFNILSGYGKEINLKTLSITSVTSGFESTFLSAGLNQTLHSIYLVVNTKAVLHMPLNNKEEICKTSILICESVLIGKVPEVYLNGTLFT